MVKKNTDDIFVDREKDIKVEIPENNIVEDKPRRKEKKKVSAERRAVLLEQLKKGRETAKKNRLAKQNKKSGDRVDSVDSNRDKDISIKIEEPKEDKVKDNIVLSKNTWSIKDDIDDLRYQLRELRSMMNKSKKEEKVEAKIEKIIEKKEEIEEKQKIIESTQSTQSTHKIKPPPSLPIPIPQPPPKVVKSLFKSAMW